MSADLERLRVRLDEGLQCLLPEPCSVALIGMPLHDNVGDHAIWLAQLKWLDRHGYTVCYRADLRSYTDEGVRWARPDLLLFQGGGSFGDVWPEAQEHREHVLAQFPYLPAVQFPQTVHFQSNQAKVRAQRAIEGHSNFQLAVRDAQSLEHVGNWQVPTVLTPDMAFELGRLRARPPSQDVVLLMRRDHERAVQSDTSGALDWVREPWPITSRQLNRLARTVSVVPSLGRAHGAVAAIWSRRQLRRGLSMLAQGHTVISDRLHAHILSVLLGRRSVVLDNSYGKLRATFDTWTSHLEGVTWATSLEEARILAAGGSEI